MRMIRMKVKAKAEIAANRKAFFKPSISFSSSNLLDSMADENALTSVSPTCGVLTFFSSLSLDSGEAAPSSGVDVSSMVVLANSAFRLIALVISQSKFAGEMSDQEIVMMPPIPMLRRFPVSMG